MIFVTFCVVSCRFIWIGQSIRTTFLDKKLGIIKKYFLENTIFILPFLFSYKTLLLFCLEWNIKIDASLFRKHRSNRILLKASQPQNGLHNNYIDLRGRKRWLNVVKLLYWCWSPFTSIIVTATNHIFSLESCFFNINAERTA